MPLVCVVTIGLRRYRPVVAYCRLRRIWIARLTNSGRVEGHGRTRQEACLDLEEQLDRIRAGLTMLEAA